MLRWSFFLKPVDLNNNARIGRRHTKSGQKISVKSIWTQQNSFKICKWFSIDFSRNTMTRLNSSEINYLLYDIR